MEKHMKRHNQAFPNCHVLSNQVQQQSLGQTWSKLVREADNRGPGTTTYRACHRHASIQPALAWYGTGRTNPSVLIPIPQQQVTRQHLSLCMSPGMRE